MLAMLNLDLLALIYLILSGIEVVVVVNDPSE